MFTYQTTAVDRVWIKWGKGGLGDIPPSGGLGTEGKGGPGAKPPEAEAFL